MKHLLTAFACLLAMSMSAQIDGFPFNPDSDDDGLITVEDLMAMLSGFGQPFELPDYSEWATGSMFNLLDYQNELDYYSDSLTLIADSVLALQIQLDEIQNNLDSVISIGVEEQTSLLLERQIYRSDYSTGYVPYDAVYVQKEIYYCGQNPWACKIRFPTEGFTVGQKVFVQFICDGGTCNQSGGTVNLEHYVNDAWTTFSSINGNSIYAYQYPVIRVATFNGESWSGSGGSFPLLPTTN